MPKVYMLPTPSQAAQNTTNSINSIVLHLAKHLPAYGWEVTEDRAESDIIAGHAGQMGEDSRVDVAHCHGLYPSAHRGAGRAWDAINANVIESLRCAQQITVPSEWVADILRRDMGIEPHVIGWAIEPDEWQIHPHSGYVLWAKTRIDAVCDPAPLLRLASARPQQQFVSTFGNADNIKTTGVLPFENMREIIAHAAVYLATTHETWGIQTVEAMACAVPVLGFKWGATADLVRHGIDGFLVHPYDYDGLLEGLEYCLKYRGVLGANARTQASQFTWDKTANAFAQVYDIALMQKSVPPNTIPPEYYEV